MKKLSKGVLGVVLVLLIAIMLSSCATEDENVGLGTALGAGIGATVSHNRWKGAFIGGMIGAVAGEAMYQVQQRAINEAIQRQQPVIYQRKTDDGGWQRVEAEPISKPIYNPNQHTTCQKIHIREVENGRVVKDRIKEVCKGTKETNTY